MIIHHLMDMAALRAPLGARGPRPPEKFGNGSYIIGQLLRQDKVLQQKTE